MAQNEGRTLRRAPKLTQRTLAFVLLVAVATGLGLGAHQLKAFAESVMGGQTVRTALPEGNRSGQATATGSPQAAALTATSEPQTTFGVPNCIPKHYDLPKTINLSNFPVGVTAVEDSPQTYTIFGNTVEQQQAQLQRCAPVDEFAGAASYQVGWQYGYAIRSDGLCEVVNPKIGLHLNMVMPKWSATDEATDLARDTWASFSAGLLVHEKGHYTISRHYAKTMLESLKHIHPQGCGTIRASVDTAMATVLKRLQAAQNNYDATTNHGATQGAVL